jgi:hypothetical protein
LRANALRQVSEGVAHLRVHGGDHAVLGLLALNMLQKIGLFVLKQEIS